MRATSSFASLVAGLILFSPSFCAPANPDCDPVPLDLVHKCMIAEAGAPSAETLNGQKRDFLRVLVFRMRRGSVIQLQRSRRGQVVMVIRDLLGAYAPYESVFPEADWQAIVARWRSLQPDTARRRAAEEAHKAMLEQGGTETICLDSNWYARTESNMTGLLQAIEGNACDDIELVDFALHVANRALAVVPRCSSVNEQDADDPVARLGACLAVNGRRNSISPR